MTSKATREKLKRAMEKQWEAPGCSRPLRIAGWRADRAYLTPNDDSRIPDEDEGYPLLPQSTR